MKYLDEIEARANAPYKGPFIAHAREDVPALVAALRAVLDLCTPQNAPDICARNVRNAIESALGGAS